MPDNGLDLRTVKTFPSLVKYLRDELDWPIESDDVEDLTFDYEPEELGLDAKTAVKIKEIKQLRPLASNQPWGDRDKVKCPALSSHTISDFEKRQIRPTPASFVFVFQNVESRYEYECGFSLSEAMPIHSKGVVTGRDHFVLDFDRDALIERIQVFRNSRDDRPGRLHSTGQTESDRDCRACGL